MKKDDSSHRQTIEDTLNRLYLSKRSAPKAAFWTFVFLYILAVIILGVTAGSSNYQPLDQHLSTTISSPVSRLISVC